MAKELNRKQHETYKEIEKQSGVHKDTISASAQNKIKGFTLAGLMLYGATIGISIVATGAFFLGCQLVSVITEKKTPLNKLFDKYAEFVADKLVVPVAFGKDAPREEVVLATESIDMNEERRKAAEKTENMEGQRIIDSVDFDSHREKIDSLTKHFGGQHAVDLVAAARENMELNQN